MLRRLGTVLDCKIIFEALTATLRRRVNSGLFWVYSGLFWVYSGLFWGTFGKSRTNCVVNLTVTLHHTI